MYVRERERDSERERENVYVRERVCEMESGCVYVRERGCVCVIVTPQVLLFSILPPNSVVIGYTVDRSLRIHTLSEITCLLHVSHKAC